jgi:DNA-binding transcriptional LysR family regulator
MDKLRAMSTFARVVETGSLSSAAQRLDTSLASVSRQIAALEEDLGATLLTRTTRRLSPTEAGRAYYARIKRLLGDLEEADLEASRDQEIPSGRLVVSAPVLFGRVELAPLVAAFIKAHPQVQVSLSLNDRFVNLVEEHVDIAVRVGKPPDSAFVARRLRSFSRIVCGSPAYLKRVRAPAHPSELTEQACLRFTFFSEANEWILRRNGESVSVQVDGPLQSDSQDALIAAAEQGLGLILVAPWAVREQLQKGRLRQVLPGWQQPPTPVTALFARSRMLSAKTRAFLDFLTESWSEKQPGNRS